jgi:hypothetical protein
VGERGVVGKHQAQEARRIVRLADELLRRGWRSRRGHPDDHRSHRTAGGQVPCGIAFPNPVCVPGRLGRQRLLDRRERDGNWSDGREEPVAIRVRAGEEDHEAILQRVDAPAAQRADDRCVVAGIGDGDLEFDLAVVRPVEHSRHDPAVGCREAGGEDGVSGGALNP